MVKRLLLLVALLLPLWAAAQDAIHGTPEALNDKYGFRDATFEKPISAFKGMELRSRKGHETSYVRKSDKLTIGEFQASEILYRFYDGLLSDISISATGGRNVRGIIQAFSVAYGDPEFKETRFTWTSTRVLMVGTVAEDLSRTTIVMSSLPLRYKKRVQQAADADKERRKQVRSVVDAASDL